MQIKPSCAALAFPGGTGHQKKARRSGVDFHLRNSSYALSLATSPEENHPFLSLVSLPPAPQPSAISLLPPLVEGKTSGEIEWSWGTCAPPFPNPGQL